MSLLITLPEPHPLPTRKLRLFDVAGSLIWVNFDRDSLLGLVFKFGGKFIANSDDVRPAFRNDTLLQADQTAIFQSSLVRDVGPAVSGTIDQLDNIPISEVSSLKEIASPWYADQVLPFDVTLTGNNEMGAATAMRIFGVEILNSGNGTSIDDTVNESQATFVARFVEPWQAVALVVSLACCRRATARAAHAVQ